MQNVNPEIEDPTNKAVIDVAADDPTLDTPAKWRKAVLDLVTHWTGLTRCYSSGEVAATLRTHRPDAMVFSSPRVGELIKELFYNGQLPSYLDDQGQPVPVVQVPRITEGLYPDRTRAGIEVFVYGSSVQACLDHPFEVFIPNPQKGETMADAPAPAVAQTVLAGLDKSGNTRTAVAIMGDRLRNQEILAKVWPDGRLCIPRNAFEAAVHLGGTPMRGGDPVYVRFDRNSVIVTFASSGVPDEKTYDLTADKGRIAVTPPAGMCSLGSGYKCSVAAGSVVVDLSQPV